MINLKNYPTLTAFGQLHLDHPKYKRERQRLVKSAPAFGICRQWLLKNGVAWWCDNSLQLKQLIQINCDLYVPQGSAICALIDVFGIEPRTDTQGIWFKHFPALIESQRENKKREKHARLPQY